MHVQEFRDNVESWDRKIMRGSNVRIKAYESDGKRDDRQKLVGIKEGGTTKT